MRSTTLLAPLLAVFLWASPPTVAQNAYQEAITEGDLLLQEREFKTAIKAFKKAHKLATGPAFECCYGLAQAYNKIGAFKNGVESSRAALAAAPGPNERVAALNLLGLALFAAGGTETAELEEAAGAFREILEHDPVDIVRYNLGVTLLKLERDAEGVALLEEFLAAEPTGPEERMAKVYVANPRRARENLVPDFDAVTLEGEYLTPDDFAGKVVLIDFWGTWCPPCVASIPHLQQLAKRTEKSPFVLLSVSNDADGDALRSFVAEHQMSWPQIWDESRELTRSIFQVRRYPTFVLVDHQGIIRYRQSGWGEGIRRDLDSRIASAIRAAKKAQKAR